MVVLRSSRSRKVKPALIHAVVEPLESRQLLSVGGGWTSAGLVGSYFNNTTFTGPASFTRRDVRIDFNWGTTMKPGGSTSPGYADIGTTNYSVQWLGDVIPKSGQEYTFDATADDTFKLELRPAGTSTWTTVINQTSNTGTDTLGHYTMVAGSTYDVRISYVQFTGAAEARLRWSSASTPLEVIDPLQNNGNNVAGDGRWMFANMVLNANRVWDTGTTDANGWPTGDSSLWIWQGADDVSYGGTYNVQFSGKAAVSVALDWNSYAVKFVVGGVQYSSLTMGQGWSSATNTTTFQMIVPATSNGYMDFAVSSTRRLPTDTTATGITNLKIMRPQTPGGNDPYPFTQLFTSNYKSASDVFTEFRWNDVNGNLGESNWSQRISPTYGIGITQGNASSLVNKGWTYEYQIMFCNETGKDLYLTTPMRSTNDYYTQLAKLLRYGSDATGTPYSAPTANPVCPPLNPNLKVYIEVANEVWNTAGGFEQTGQAAADAAAASTAAVGSTARNEWNNINYDGTVTTTTNIYDSNYYVRVGRWYALRAVRMSQQFRSIYGDANMGTVVRPLLFWQYNNAWNTAMIELKFLDDYFNNGDGTAHVTTPEPASYFIWGAGGASYYGSGNSQGTLTTDPIVNPSFDIGGLPLGVATLRPTISGWTFTGNAGAYGSGGSSYTSNGVSMGALPAPSTGSYAAYILRGGTISQNITFTSSGSYAIGFTAYGVNTFPIDCFLGSTRITPSYHVWDGTGDPYPASGPAAITQSWNRNIAAGWVTLLTTAVVNVTIPAGQSSVTLQFQVGNPGSSNSANDYILFDKFYVASADALYNGGIPDTGQALGQTANGPWAQDRGDIAEYVLAYGLTPSVYESGWSLGGDNGSSPFQNTLKYYDPRSTIANNVAINTHSQAGYGMVTYGVYSSWDEYNTSSAANSDLRQSFDQENNMLPAAPTDGVSVGTTLTASNEYLNYIGSGTNWSFSRNATSSLTPREWLDWNVIVPTLTAWKIVPTTGSGGTVDVLVDNAVVATFTSGSSATQPIVTLTPGMHSIRLRSKSGTFSATSLAFQQVAAPTFNSFTVNDGNAQRSMVKSLQVVFGSAVTVAGDAFSLTSRSGAPVAFSFLSSNPSGDGKTYILTFSGTGISGNSVPDGAYKLLLRTASVTDAYGQAVTGANLTLKFYRLFGDVNGDRVVDRSDLAAFRAALGQSATLFWYFDYDGNGTIDANDYAQLRKRLIRPLL